LWAPGGPLASKSPGPCRGFSVRCSSLLKKNNFFMCFKYILNYNLLHPCKTFFYKINILYFKDILFQQISLII
jgi:hypothetical protein